MTNVLCALLASTVASGCVAHVPPPIVSRLRGPAPLPEDTITVSLAFGIQPELLQERKIGMQIAVEYQATNELSIGFATAVGTGLVTPEFGDRKPDVPLDRLWLIAGRFFGQWNANGADWAATTFGVGIGVMNTGLSYLTLDAGEAIGYPNETAVPHAAGVVAVSLPLSHGRAFGARPRVPTETQFYVGGLAGLRVPLGSHQLAAEVGLLKSLRMGDEYLLSIGDAYSPTPD